MMLFHLQAAKLGVIITLIVIPKDSYESYEII